MHAHTVTDFYELLFVQSAAHLKAKRSALCQSSSSVHIELTLSFRKVRHISIYVLLLCNNRTNSDQRISSCVRRWQNSSVMFCYGVCWRVKAKLSLCLIMHCCMTAGVWTSRSTAPRIPNLNTRRRWVIGVAPWPLYPRGQQLGVH